MHRCAWSLSSMLTHNRNYHLHANGNLKNVFYGNRILLCVSPVCAWQSCASHLQSAHRHHCSAVGPAPEVMSEPAGGPEHHSPTAVQCGWSSLPLRCPDNTTTSWNTVMTLDFVSNLAACGLTRVKVNFWVWVKWVPLVRVLSEGAEHLKVWSTSERSELEALWGNSSAAERSCSTMRLRSRVTFLLWCSCWKSVWCQTVKISFSLVHQDFDTRSL